MSQSVICIASNVSQAEAIVDGLKMSGFSNGDISLLMPDQDGLRDFAHEKHSKAPEGTSAGASAGALAGGTLGWLAGIGSIAIPGVGPFIAAGPVMGALAGAAVGGAVGGVTGGLIGLGIPEFEAKQYEGKLQKGNILISVHTENTDEAKSVERMMKTVNADEIHRVDEESVKYKH